MAQAVSSLNKMLPPNVEIVVEEEYEAICRRTADFLCHDVKARVEQSGRYSLVLSGGSTPKRLYEILGSDAFKARAPWEKVHFFWGDERCVSPEDSQSNYKLAWDAFLSHLNLLPANLHRLKGEMEPGAAALEYESQLRDFFGPVEFPVLDFILLGLGPDGHTASLFPGTPALSEKRRWVVSNYVEKLKANRLTFTYPVLNAARISGFLVSGEEKAPVVSAILDGKSSYPAAGVRPERGKLLWFLDKGAACNLLKQP